MSENTGREFLVEVRIRNTKKVIVDGLVWDIIIAEAKKQHGIDLDRYHRARLLFAEIVDEIDLESDDYVKVRVYKRKSPNLQNPTSQNAL